MKNMAWAATVGLQVMQVAGQDGEFVVLEYAGGDKLYVPVQQLHLVVALLGRRARERAAAQARHRPVG
mgnify:CR=1 FL=1